MCLRGEASYVAANDADATLPSDCQLLWQAFSQCTTALTNASLMQQCLLHAAANATVLGASTGVASMPIVPSRELVRLSKVCCCIAGEVIDGAALLSLPCDVLVPAAIGSVITSENAHTLNCKYVVEAANGPTTPNVSCCSLA